MTLADAHADAGADAGSANPSSAPGAGGARAAARVEGFRYVQSLAASAGGRREAAGTVALLEKMTRWPTALGKRERALLNSGKGLARVMGCRAQGPSPTLQAE